MINLKGLKVFQRKFITAPGNETGATLVELLVTLAISLGVVFVITNSMVQFILVSRWGNQQLLTSNSIQTASLWLGRDVPEADSFIPGTGAEYGTLNWEDSSQQFRYSYNSTNETLVREHLVNSVVQSTITAARNIASQGDIVFSTSGNLLTVSVTATEGDLIDSAVLSLAMRAQ